jgi:ubiquinone biosynthesis protein
VGKVTDQLSRRLAETLCSLFRALVIAWVVARVVAAVGYQVIVHHARPIDALARQLAPALSRLGTASIKLGQLIASSPGTFPAALVHACSELRDNVKTDRGFDIGSLLAAELGEDAGLLRSVEVTPIAAASIAQVHLGQLDDGTRVAIKVQRPGVAGTLATDLRLLTSLARIMARVFPSLRRIDITGVMGTLGDQLLSELDFSAELHNAQVLRSALKGTRIGVPRCFAELCTGKVLVMEYLPGQPLSVCATRIEAAGAGPATARRVVEALLAPLASVGVFHADMHGGNLIVGPDGALGMVDFGCVSQLDKETSQCLSGALLALFERRFQEAACALLSLMDVTHADLAAAQDELVAVTSTYLDRSIEDLPVGLVIKQLIGIGTAHGIVMPVSLLSLMRQMLFLDGITRDLDATFNFLDEGAAVLRVAMGISGSEVTSESGPEPVADAMVRRSPRMCGGAFVREMTTRVPQSRRRLNSRRRTSCGRTRRSVGLLATPDPLMSMACLQTRRR